MTYEGRVGEGRWLARGRSMYRYPWWLAASDGFAEGDLG